MGTREGVGEASVAVRMGRLLSIESSLIGSAEAVVAVEGNTGWTAKVRGRPGSAVSKNPCTYVNLVSGPGRAWLSPGASRGLVGKEKPVTHEGREEAIGFIHSSDEAGEQGGETLCGVGGAKGRQGEFRLTKVRTGPEPDCRDTGGGRIRRASRPAVTT